MNKSRISLLLSLSAFLVAGCQARLPSVQSPLPVTPQQAATGQRQGTGSVAIRLDTAQLDRQLRRTARRAGGLKTQYNSTQITSFRYRLYQGGDLIATVNSAETNTFFADVALGSVEVRVMAYVGATAINKDDLEAIGTGTVTFGAVTTITVHLYLADSPGFADQIGNLRAIVNVHEPSSGGAIDASSPYGPLGSSVAMATNPSWHDEPSLAYNPDRNEYLITWEDDRNYDDNDYDIFARRLDSNGNPLGPEFALALASDWQGVISIAYNTVAQEYLVVWEDYRDPSGNGDIYGQRLTSTAALIGGNFAVNSDEDVDQHNPSATYNPVTNELLVVWTDSRNSTEDIYARRITSTGTPLGEVAIASGDHYQTDPTAVANTLNGDYFVVWTDQGSSASDVAGRRLSSNGSAAGPSIALVTAPGGQYSSHAAFNAGLNNYMVVWQDSRSNINSDIYGQRVTSVGSLLGANLPICTEETEYQYDPRVAVNNQTDEYMTVWYDGRNGQNDVFAQRLTATGTLLGTFFAVSTEPVDKYYAAIAYNSTADEFLSVWEQEDENGDYGHVYGRRVK